MLSSIQLAAFLHTAQADVTKGVKHGKTAANGERAVPGGTGWSRSASLVAAGRVAALAQAQLQQMGEGGNTSVRPIQRHIRRMKMMHD